MSNGSRVYARRASGSSGQKSVKGRWSGMDADKDMSDDQQVGLMLMRGLA